MWPFTMFLSLSIDVQLTVSDNENKINYKFILAESYYKIWVLNEKYLITFYWSPKGFFFFKKKTTEELYL